MFQVGAEFSKLDVLGISGTLTSKSQRPALKVIMGAIDMVVEQKEKVLMVMKDRW